MIPSFLKIIFKNSGREAGEAKARISLVFVCWVATVVFSFENRNYVLLWISSTIEKNMFKGFFKSEETSLPVSFTFTDPLDAFSAQMQVSISVANLTICFFATYQTICFFHSGLNLAEKTKTKTFFSNTAFFFFLAGIALNEISIPWLYSFFSELSVQYKENLIPVFFEPNLLEYIYFYVDFCCYAFSFWVLFLLLFYFSVLKSNKICRTKNSFVLHTNYDSRWVYSFLVITVTLAAPSAFFVQQLVLLALLLVHELLKCFIIANEYNEKLLKSSSNTTPIFLQRHN